VLVSDEPWAQVYRVPRGWLKVCAPVQRFEPQLTVSLYERWPDRVSVVLEHDDTSLLLADAGAPIGSFDPYVNPPEAWERVLPLYAELQLGEIEHVHEHLAGGVPDLRTDVLPHRYAQMVARTDLPLEAEELERLRRFVPRYAELCAELESRGIADSIQHDDLHMANVYDDRGTLRVLDWGDSCVSHPFMSVFETFRHLDESEFHPRLRDVYLEPWGTDLLDTFELALRVGTIAHSFAWLRQYDNLRSDEERRAFGIQKMLRLAVAETD
jgi:hypothetical protein